MNRIACLAIAHFSCVATQNESQLPEMKTSESQSSEPLQDIQSVLNQSTISASDIITDAKKQNLKKNPPKVSFDEIFGLDHGGKPRVKKLEVNKDNYIGDEDLTQGYEFEDYNQRRKKKGNIQDTLRIDYDDMQQEYQKHFNSKYDQEITAARKLQEEAEEAGEVEE